MPRKKFSRRLHAFCAKQGIPIIEAQARDRKCSRLPRKQHKPLSRNHRLLLPNSPFAGPSSFWPWVTTT
jgi:hypothetical protein